MQASNNKDAKLFPTLSITEIHTNIKQTAMMHSLEKLKTNLTTR